MIRFWDSLRKPVLIMTGDLSSWAVKITDRVWGSLRSVGAQNHPAKQAEGRRTDLIVRPHGGHPLVKLHSRRYGRA
jgi:hypothetical protein